MFNKIDDSKKAAKIILSNNGTVTSEGLSWTSDDSAKWQAYCNTYGGAVQVVPDYHAQTPLFKEAMVKALNKGAEDEVLKGVSDPDPVSVVVTEPEAEADSVAEGENDATELDVEKDDEELTDEELEALTNPSK